MSKTVISVAGVIASVWAVITLAVFAGKKIKRRRIKW